MRDETATVTVETAIVAPVLLMLVLVVVFAGRAARIDGEVTMAATQAARAASLAPDPLAADEASRAVVATNLADAGIACTELRVDTDTVSFAPGGHVEVTASCLVANDDIALAIVPGVRWSAATAVQPIDRYRGGG